MAQAIKKKAKKQPPTAVAHFEHKDGEHHAVTILHLHVMIVPESKYWFAQGLEIDFAVQGNSVEDVKNNFQVGIKATIHQNLKMFGHIDNILRVAPNEVWHEFRDLSREHRKVYSQVSMHEIIPELEKTHPQVFQQIDSIKYTVTSAAAATVC